MQSASATPAAGDAKALQPNYFQHGKDVATFSKAAVYDLVKRR